MPKRLDENRRAELFDGVMRIISARGFSDVRISEIANELHCSVASLYKIAPSKDSLVLLAITRWGKCTLERLDGVARRERSAADQARAYFRAGATSIHPMSVEFFADVERFESTRVAWQANVVGPYLSRFVELVQCAADAGETRPVNIRFLAEMLGQIALVTRDERVLRASEMTAEEAVMQVDDIIWQGIGRR